ncbi:MAG: hypothetical protein U1D55_04800 [Phycisphaerae bacterium]
MTQTEAIAAVRDQRERLRIDPEMPVVSAERAIVEFLADRERPGVPEHRVAWIVEFAAASGFARVQMDDASGKVLHVQRSA